LIGILFVFGVGIVAVMMQNKDPRQMATDSYMLTTKALNDRAREACPEAVRKHSNVILGLPNDTVSDGVQQVTLNWKGGGAGNPPVACTYVLDQGVVALTIDGKPFGS
ncbi:MAG: hypothetical protein ACT4QB_06745, partial [Gammaproteobacteria bacterium]